MKKKIAALQARLQELQAKAKAIVDAADKDGGGVMAEEQRKEFDALLDEVDQIKGDIKRLESMEALNESTGRLTKPAKPADPEARSTRVEVGADGIEKDPMRGFRDAADLGRAVMNASRPSGGSPDPRLERLHREAAAENVDVQGAPADFHRETGSSDGYMVPPAMREEIWQGVFSGDGILDAVAPEPTASNVVGLLADESTPWGTTGVKAYWESESAEMIPTGRLATEPRLVRLHKLFAFVLATEELLEDAPRLAARLTTKAAEAIRWKAEQAIVEGNGTGKPLGWMRSNALVSVAKETSQTADTVVAANVLKMFARLHPDAVNPFWLAHKSVLPQLGLMTIGNQPIWTPPSEGMKAAPGGVLLGMPVRFSQHCETVGDKGDIQLVAPNGYYAATKTGGVKGASSIHLYFNYDMQAFRWTFRLGGQPLLSAAVSPAKGAETLSHFVTLAERAAG